MKTCKFVHYQLDDHPDQLEAVGDIQPARPTKQAVPSYLEVLYCFWQMNLSKGVMYIAEILFSYKSEADNLIAVLQQPDLFILQRVDRRSFCIRLPLCMSV